ncbi:MAG: 3'-5' exonuclease [Clostridia bacterium]|nr:3'-5' exonuclease [Clostridia bacterium]
MAVLYFDTETSSLTPGQICQLAYIIEDRGIISSKNFYFTVNSIDPVASSITGLTVPRLKVLSGGRLIGDDIEEIACDFSSASVVVAHNFNFDWCFMRKEFERENRVFRFKEKFCSMREFTTLLKLPSQRGGYKYPSLEELARCYGVSNDETVNFMEEQFAEQSGAHDARYDTCKMYLALSKARTLHGELCEYFNSKL